MFDQNARNYDCRIDPSEVPEPTECSWQGAATSYYIRSSVLGGETIAETGSSGQKMVSYVRVGSSILAHLRTNRMWQQGGWVTSEAAYYENTDPSGTGFRVTPRLMPANWWDYSDQRKAEFDSGNSNVGLETNYQPVYEPGPSENLPLESESPLYVDGQKASVTIDGISVSWLIARQMAEAGALQIALYDGTDRYFTDVHATTGGLSWISRVTARTTSNFNPRTEQYEISYSTDISGISWGLGQRDHKGGTPITHPTKPFPLKNPFLDFARNAKDYLAANPHCTKFINALLVRLQADSGVKLDGDIFHYIDEMEKHGTLNAEFAGRGESGGFLTSHGNAIQKDFGAPGWGIDLFYSQWPDDYAMTYLGELVHAVGRRNGRSNFSDTAGANATHAMGFAMSLADFQQTPQVANLKKRFPGYVDKDTGDYTGAASVLFHGVFRSECARKL